MAKAQRSVKTHGPKRNLFHKYTSSGRLTMGQAGMLSKYYDEESFRLACMARGVKNPTSSMWNEFHILPTKKAKDEYLAGLKK